MKINHQWGMWCGCRTSLGLRDLEIVGDRQTRCLSGSFSVQQFLWCSEKLSQLPKEILWNFLYREWKLLWHLRWLCQSCDFQWRQSILCYRCHGSFQRCKCSLRHKSTRNSKNRICNRSQSHDCGSFQQPTPAIRLWISWKRKLFRKISSR